MQTLILERNKRDLELLFPFTRMNLITYFPKNLAACSDHAAKKKVND